MTTPDRNDGFLADMLLRRAITGHLAEWEELQGVIAEKLGLTVVVSDPWSGTTGLLDAAGRMARDPVLLIDARRCNNAVDLGMAIADEAIRTFAPDALASWTGLADPTSSPGLRVFHQLAGAGVPLEELQTGSGSPHVALRAGIDSAVALSTDRQAPVIAIDHLGLMLSGMRAADARTALDVIRSARQAHLGLNLLLVDYAGGPIEAALADQRHPLYRAGGTLRVRRASAERFHSDLAAPQLMDLGSASYVREAATLAHGVPSLTWRVVDRGYPLVEDTATLARSGWEFLRAETAPLAAREWDALRSMHPAALAVVAALSLGVAPHSLPLASKSVRDALLRLRAAGITWQPAPRTWALASPLLAAWAAEHAPPWGVRRAPTA